MNEVSIFEDKLSDKEKVKFALLGNRLGLTEDNAKFLFDSIHRETAAIFSLPETHVNSDIEFVGREFDFVYTIKKQDIPENKA